MGQPGDRTFYLQASDDTGRTVSVALEKTQVQVLADRMSELLDEVAGAASGRRRSRPTPTSTTSSRSTAPVDEEFRVAAMGLAWDGADEAVVVEARRRHRRADRRGGDPLRQRGGPRRAAGDASRRWPPAPSSPAPARVVAAGRPPCPLCSLPLDPDRARLPAAERLPPLTGGRR